MRKCILGIDLGTSSVKIMKKYRDGSSEKLKNSYTQPFPAGWWNSIIEILKEINWEEVEAIGLTSQVGTYLINDKYVIGWNEAIGKEELAWWKTKYSQKEFVDEISMPHPEVISYPLPRLKYIKEHFENIQTICQPKEYILKKLTGEYVTDEYSWRGLCHLEKKKYSSRFLKELGLDEAILPIVKEYGSRAGYTRKIVFGNHFLPQGIPVYTGLNDYYAGLLGMGIGEVGEMFDITGTSEHLGILQDFMETDTKLVTGPYLEHIVNYGVTASSGASIKFGLKLNNTEMFDMEKIMKKKPPIFLPYLKGERAPIWNPDARGVFFGMEESCDSEILNYSVMEGVVFSLYHIYENMGKPMMKKITVSGGAAKIPALNQLKSEIFRTSIKVVKESDVSALGACMVAAVGEGWYSDYKEVSNAWVEINQTYNGSNRCSDWFEKRFEVYKELYNNVKPLYEKWREL